MLDYLLGGFDIPALIAWLVRFFLVGAVVLLAVVLFAGLVDALLTGIRGHGAHAR